MTQKKQPDHSSMLHVFFAALGFACFLPVFAPTALAAPVAGCDQQVLDAMHATAGALQAYDGAVVEQITKQPESGLVATCFNQKAGHAAQTNGTVFSGDFTASLSNVMDNALADTYSQYSGTSGTELGAINYGGASGVQPWTGCTGINDLWDAQELEGLRGGVPYISFNDLQPGAPPPGAGADFASNWNAADFQAALTQKDATVNALPLPAHTDYTGLNTVCEILLAEGLVAVCP